MRIPKSLSRALRLPALFILCAAPASAQPAYRVKDIDTAVQVNSLNIVGGAGALNSTILFGASSIGNPEQLWRSDGTRESTSLVKSIHASGYGAPNSFAELGGSLYFFVNGTELWKSDGTPAGTALVKIVGPGAAARELVAADDALFFAADDGVHGFELWRSDGTTEGTAMVADLFPGNLGSDPRGLIPTGSGVAFVAADIHGDFALWKSDGTAAGTVVFADLGETPPRGPYALTRVALDRFFFATQQQIDQTVTFTLWKSDGTQAGTVALRDFVADWPGVCAGPCFPRGPSDLAPLGEGIVFVANDGVHGRELWRSDGTAAGTVLVSDIVSGAESSEPQDLVRLGSRVYFSATDGAHGYELWGSDGTAAGTSLVRDINPGPGDSSPYGLTAFGGVLVFVAAHAASHYGLWVSDGTSGGTRLLKDVGVRDNGYGLFTAVGGSLFFFGVQSNVLGLWKTDGTEQGTVLVSDFAPDRTTTAGSSPYFLTDFAGRLLFLVQDPDLSNPRTTLWRSDGAESGTIPLAPFLSFGSGPFVESKIVPFAGAAFFAADDAVHGTELWRTDGTAEGTGLWKELRPGVVGSDPYELAVVANRLFFAAFDEQGGGLWTTDGTPEGTRKISSVVPTGENFEPLALGDALIFLGADADHGGELWRSDGTESGTFMIKDINPGTGWSSINRLAAAGGKVYCSAYDGVTVGLWVSDGTEQGTVSLATFDAAFGTDLTAAGALVFFTNYGQTELWRSDGTPEGTFVAKTIRAFNLTGVGGTLYFDADDGVHGPELWKSDGSTKGTTMVADINPGASGSGPTELTSIDGTLVFSADDGEHGYELWRSDGTEGGTRMIQDINPGAASSAPSQFTRSGSLLYFTADDGVTGTELWAIPLAALQTPRETIEPVSRDSAARAVTPRQ